MSTGLVSFFSTGYEKGIEPKAQLQEIVDYLPKAGIQADIVESDDILNGIRALCAILNEMITKISSDTDLESILNSLLTLLIPIPAEKSTDIYLDIASKLSDNVTERPLIRMRILYNLYNSLEAQKATQGVIYILMVKVASEAKLLPLIPHKLPEIKLKVNRTWDLSTEAKQDLYRSLQIAYDVHDWKEDAIGASLELLSTYTLQDSCSEKAMADATSCIVAHIKNPNTFIFDHLLELAPVKAFCTQPIYELLNIFIEKNLDAFNVFRNKHESFLKSLGLNIDQCIYKMRLLTLIQMGTVKSELSFNELASELELPLDEIESYIIEALQSKVIDAKIDNIKQRALISVKIQRQFTAQNWHVLRSQLEQWNTNLAQARGYINSLFVNGEIPPPTGQLMPSQ